jgi:hypothetical protein
LAIGSEGVGDCKLISLIDDFIGTSRTRMLGDIVSGINGRVPPDIEGLAGIDSFGGIKRGRGEGNWVTVAIVENIIFITDSTACFTDTVTTAVNATIWGDVGEGEEG